MREPSNHRLGTPDQLRDPNYTPPAAQTMALGLQHVLAMFASNVTPPFIVASAAGLAGGDLVLLIQAAMIFSGTATLIQTIGFGPVGARLPIVQGTSFAFLPIMIPVAKTAGVAAVLSGAVIGGLFHFLLGTIISRIRGWLPPLVTGIVILSIGLMLIPVGIKYAAGGVGLLGEPEFGAWRHWLLALAVIAVSLGLKILARGLLSSVAILVGLLVGYLMAIPLGMVDFEQVAQARWFAAPQILRFGFELNFAAILGMCFMSIVSTIETVGDISGITKGGAGREASDREIAGGTMADGLGTALAGLFGGLPNTSFSQNVGLIAMTGIMSRHVVTCGAAVLVLAGLVPKLGAIIAAMPAPVLGGGVILMFGMVAAAGLRLLGDVPMNRRNMIIAGVALSVGLGLQAVPQALQHLPAEAGMLLSSGILPAALIAVVLNRFVPESLEDH